MDFIKNNKRLAGGNPLAHLGFKKANDTLRLDVFGEIGTDRLVCLKVDVGDIFIMLRTKFAQDMCLSNLSGTVNQQDNSLKNLMTMSHKCAMI